MVCIVNEAAPISHRRQAISAHRKSALLLVESADSHIRAAPLDQGVV